MARQHLRTELELFSYRKNCRPKLLVEPVATRQSGAQLAAAWLAEKTHS